MIRSVPSLLWCLAAAAAAVLPAPGLLAHGGQYRGPIDVVPPGPGHGGGAGGPLPSGPTTPGSGPRAPGPHGPPAPGTGAATGAPGPAGGRTGTATPRGVPTDGDDLSRWDFWWEFNKDPFLRLKDALAEPATVTGDDGYHLGLYRHVQSRDQMLPSAEDKRDRILPALLRASEATDQRDITTSCMVAMAKLGIDPPNRTLRDVFAPRLRDGDQEVSETAALALGIAARADAASIDLLANLALDTKAGRDASARPEVNDRTRAFACYGLGLIAHASADLGVQRRILVPLRALVDDDQAGSRNVKVAAINALGLLRIDAGSAAGARLRGEAVQSLLGFHGRDLGVGAQLVQAHVPPAVAKLLRGANDAGLLQRCKDLFAADLAGKGRPGRTSHDLARSAALALGQLCEPVADATAADAGLCRLLLDAWHGHKDAQTRYFAVLALGQIGGAWNRARLMAEFRTASKSLEKPWVALALGVMAFAQHAAERRDGRSIQVDGECGRLLHDALLDGSDPIAVSALAVALGLSEYAPAADDMRRLLAENEQKADLAGYLCIGLALLDDQRSKGAIHELVLHSVRRPELLRQAAVALGRLGDKAVTTDLQALLDDADPNLAKLSAVAAALGFIGDRRSIAPLATVLGNESLGALSRAFAAVALGGIGDKERLPWNSKIGCGINYRAAVETLTDQQAGILDIL